MSLDNNKLNYFLFFYAIECYLRSVRRSSDKAGCYQNQFELIVDDDVLADSFDIGYNYIRMHSSDFKKLVRTSNEYLKEYIEPTDPREHNWEATEEVILTKAIRTDDKFTVEFFYPARADAKKRVCFYHYFNCNTPKIIKCSSAFPERCLSFCPLVMCNAHTQAYVCPICGEKN